MPGIHENWLLSTGKFAATNYITIFDKEEVNIYDANSIIIAVTKGAILQGWWDAGMKLLHIPLVVVVRNTNTNIIIVNWPSTEFLPERTPPTDSIHNVYELKMQPELVHYYQGKAAPDPQQAKERKKGS